MDWLRVIYGATKAGAAQDRDGGSVKTAATDFIAGPSGFFEQQHARSAGGHQSGCHAAGRAGADDDGIPHVGVLHAVFPHTNNMRQGQQRAMLVPVIPA